MRSNLPRAHQELAYDREATAYLRSLPPEHFMEATPQATQRKITLESLDLLQARRPEVQVFNELLVQYPVRGRRQPGQVVPDNMIVLTTERIRARRSYNVPLEPARPFCVMEYVSKGSERKDYDDNFRKYERQLKVPYYLIFYPDEQELTLYRHNQRNYVSVKPNAHGRYALAELALEVALHDGWVRYWYEGKLLPLPPDLQRALDEAQREAAEAQQAAAKAQEVAAEAQQVAAEAKRRADALQERLETAERELAELRARWGRR